MERLLHKYILINSIFVQMIFCKYVNFRFGWEYEYKFHLDTNVKDLGRFLIDAKVGYTNIDNQDGFQEILLRIYTFSVTTHSENHSGSHTEFSKWFSFEITQRGEILRVYHPPEDSEVLAIKKGFAAVFSSKLHSKEEIIRKSIDVKSWEYFTEEVGNEGPHSAVYKVKETPEGIEFKKQRKGHIIPNAKGTLTKVLHFHNKLGIIHKVMIEEDFAFT